MSKIKTFYEELLGEEVFETFLDKQNERSVYAEN